MVCRRARSTIPGGAALEAVANPSRTPDLYFVADGSGGHAFSGTIEEHNRNVLRWRQIERVAKDKVDIDKLSPTATQPAPPGKPGDQRSDADDAAFGLLPTVVASTSLGPQMLFTDPTANHDIDRIAAAEERGVPPAARSGAKPASPRQDPAHYANLDDMSFAFSDGQAKATAAVDLLDGPITESPAAATTAVAQTPVARDRAGGNACRAPRRHARDARRLARRRRRRASRPVRRSRGRGRGGRAGEGSAGAPQDLRRVREHAFRSAAQQELRPQHREDDPGRSCPRQLRPALRRTWSAA